eukprot:7388038-Prymnesium_polylepis.1
MAGAHVRCSLLWQVLMSAAPFMAGAHRPVDGRAVRGRARQRAGGAAPRRGRGLVERRGRAIWAEERACRPVLERGGERGDL